LAPVDRISRGDAYDLSRLSLGTHAGTHVDPPVHFFPGGVTVDRLDLDVLQGPCQVLALPEDRRGIGLPELADLADGTERVLFRTRNSTRWAARLEFFPDFVGMTPEAARAVRERGVRLVGIDALSVEQDPTGRFPVHRELLGHGVPIVEGLLLASAAPGAYHLDCLPLRIRDGDGGPARAVLRSP
jgi:arylformamidase